MFQLKHSLFLNLLLLVEHCSKYLIGQQTILVPSNIFASYISRWRFPKSSSTSDGYSVDQIHLPRRVIFPSFLTTARINKASFLSFLLWSLGNDELK